MGTYLPLNSFLRSGAGLLSLLDGAIGLLPEFFIKGDAQDGTWKGLSSLFPQLGILLLGKEKFFLCSSWGVRVVADLCEAEIGGASDLNG